MRPKLILPGTVVYLRQQPLRDDKYCRMTRIIQRENKPRPHVCVDANEQSSVWSSFTSRDDRPRLHIPSFWREGGFQRWRANEELYLWDGAFLIVGPTRTILNAAQGTELLGEGDRARVASDGLWEIRKEVMKQRIRRPHWFDSYCAGLGLVLRWQDGYSSAA